MTATEIVLGIQAGDESATKELYEALQSGIRWIVYRQLGSRDGADVIHDVFLAVLKAIQRGELREPGRLMGFVRTVAQRTIGATIEDRVRDRHEANAGVAKLQLVRDPGRPADAEILDSEKSDIAARAMEAVSQTDREILTRYYYLEQAQAQIMAEMGLTETQFRLLKSRAKTRFGAAGRRAMLGRIPRAA